MGKKVSIRVKPTDAQTRIAYAKSKPNFTAIVLFPDGKKSFAAVHFKHNLEDMSVEFMPTLSGKYSLVVACTDPVIRLSLLIFQGYRRKSAVNLEIVSMVGLLNPFQILDGCPCFFTASAGILKPLCSNL